MPAFISDLDAPLLRLGPNSVLDLRTLLCGLMIWGATGAGKTSAARVLRWALLRAGFGLLVFMAKPEELALFLGDAKANGRARSVIVFDETSRFNFLDWLIAKYGLRGLGTITDCLLRIVEAVDLAAGGLGGASQEAFWRDATRSMIAYCVPVLHAAIGRVTVANIVAFVNSAATDAKQYLDPDFAASSFAARTLRKAVDHPAVRLPKDTLDAALEYWFRSFTTMVDKTRSNVLISLTTKLDRFVQPGMLRDCFCSEQTTVVPEMMFGGGIILMNLPVLTHGEDGIIAQHLMKYLAMLAVNGRNALEPRYRERPVVFYADEAHHFVSLKDDEFLATCRGSRAAIVFLSQNLPSFYGKLGENRVQTVNGLVGKFNTHLFHLNPCPVTNEWASRLIGRGLTERGNRSRSAGTNRTRGLSDGRNTSDGQSHSPGIVFNSNFTNNAGTGQSWNLNVGDGSSETASVGTSEQMDNLVEPNYFATALRPGGPRNRNLVTGLMFRAGAQFRESGGRNTILLTFKQ